MVLAYPRCGKGKRYAQSLFCYIFLGLVLYFIHYGVCGYISLAEVDFGWKVALCYICIISRFINVLRILFVFQFYGGSGGSRGSRGSGGIGGRWLIY